VVINIFCDALLRTISVGLLSPHDGTFSLLYFASKNTWGQIGQSHPGFVWSDGEGEESIFLDSASMAHAPHAWVSIGISATCFHEPKQIIVAHDVYQQVAWRNPAQWRVPEITPPVQQLPLAVAPMMCWFANFPCRAKLPVRIVAARQLPASPNSGNRNMSRRRGSGVGGGMAHTICWAKYTWEYQPQASASLLFIATGINHTRCRIRS